MAQPLDANKGIPASGGSDWLLEARNPMVPADDVIVGNGFFQAYAPKAKRKRL